MTRKLTFLILALFALIAGPGWGQSKGNGDSYELVTSAPTDWSGTYLFAYVNGTSAYVYNGTDSGANNGVSATISSNTISFDEGMVEIEIASMTGGYSLKVIGGTNNGKYLSGGTSNGTTFNTNAVANSLSMNTDGTVKINNNTTTSFQFNSASDQQRFRYFKSAQKGVKLYKKQSTPSTNFTVTYNANDATSGTVPVDENEYESSASVTVLGNTGNLARTNYTFGGWNTQADGEGTTYQAGNTFEISANTTLYAKWIADPKYNLTYKANGGVGEDVVEQYFNNEAVTISNCTFTYEGHRFVNWNTATDGSGDSYGIGATYTMTTAGLTLYAQWEETSEVEFTYDFTDLNKFYTNPEMTVHPLSSSSNQYLTLYYENGDVFTTSSTSSSYFASYQGNTYFILGKSEAIMNLPTKSGYKITQIKFKSTTSHSKNVTVSIFSGENEVSTEQKWEIQDHEYIYDIASAYQNDRLSIKVTNDYNTQFESITLVCEPSTTSIITVDPASLSIPAEGEDYGTISVEYTNFVPEIGVVEFYSDQACTSITDPDWILADFATGSTTSIEYMADENTTFESRSVFMKITLLDEDENELSTIIPVTQEGLVQTFNATISINGTVNTTEGITEIVLPANETAPAGFTFAGWTTTESNVNPTHFVSGTVHLSENTTFYAVFSREEGGIAGSGNYEKVTSALTDWRGNYLIAYSDDVFMDGSLAGGKEGVGATQSHVAPGDALSGNVITAAWGDEHYVTIEAIDDNNLSNGYVIRTHSSDTPYFYYTTNSSNGMSSTDNKTTAAAYPITVTFNNANDIDIALGGNASGSILHYNDTEGSTGEMFRFYKDGGQSPVYLYKKSAGTSGVTHYYTRVYDENTELATLNVQGPSIILSGKILTVTGTMSNSTASNLVIEDGAQLFQNSSNVLATFQKNITGYTGDNDNYYLIANPTDNDAVANLTSNEYDLYSFDPCGDKDGYEWINEEGEEVFVKPYSNEDGSAVAVGYLYANSEDVTLEFAGVLNPAGSTDIELTYAEEGEGREFPGFNLIGNPFACNAYVNGYNFYTMADGEFVINEGSATIAPCEGFFVEATEANQSVTVSTAAPVTAPNALSLNVSQNRGNVIDRAIVRFDGANDLHKFMMNPAHTNLSIAKGGETFAAISTEAEGELPVNFKAEKNGTYTITVNTKNVDAEYLHLIDNMTGMDVDLLSTPSYTFEAKTSDYASRFKLVFGVNNTASESSDSNFAFMSDGNLVIDNIEGEATLQIVDELGRVISTETVSGSYNKALNLKAGLYILNLNGMTQKIVVE